MLAILGRYTDILDVPSVFNAFSKQMSRQLLIHFIVILNKQDCSFFSVRNGVNVAVSFVFLYLQPLKIEYFDFKAATGDQWINAQVDLPKELLHSCHKAGIKLCQT